MLLERDGEIQQLRSALRQARRGRGRLLLVSGEAGIGKTTLVRSFCAEVRGARILHGACDALTTPRPLGPLLDIAGALGGALTDLEATASRETLFREFLAELSSPAWVTVAVIEDAHWADEASLDLLRFLARRLEEVPAVLIVTFRPQDMPPDHPLLLLAGELATSSVVQQLALEPLSLAAVQELTRQATDAVVADARLLHRKTGGNPFYVTEVLAARTHEVPVSVRDAVLARMVRLDPAARRTAEAASIAPARIEQRLLRALAGTPASAIDACVGAGVLAPASPGMVAFRHELARIVVEESLPPARRATLNAAAVELLLADPGADPARVAHHAEQAGMTEVAFDHSVRAAQHAAALGSQREAADQYERALRHREGQAPERVADVLESSARAALDADRVDAAVAAADEAVALRRRLGDPLRLGASLVTRNAAVWNAGRSQEAYADGMAAVELLETLPPGPELAAAYAFVATDKMLSRDYEAAAAWGTKAVTLAERIGAVQPLARALNSMGAARILAGDVGGAGDIRRSIEVATQAGLDVHVASAWINLGSAAGEVREYDLAHEGLAHGIAYGAERDFDGVTHYGKAWLARVSFEQGRWHDADRLVAELALDGPGTLAITRITGLVVQGRLAARRGQLACARPLLEHALTMAEQTGDLQRLWPAAAGQAELAWLDGGRAGTALEAAFALAQRIRHPWACGELGFWLQRLGAAAELPPFAAHPYRLQCGGSWQEAAAAWGRRGCPYEQAEALLDSADPDALRSAVSMFDDLGAAPAAARARRRLRELGERSVPRGPQRATADHPVGLTRRQAEVLELMAHGLSDAEIAQRLNIAVKTAGHHVSAVLGRLGVTSRTQAARRAHELGLVRGQR